jgi:hypothetical protein
MELTGRQQRVKEAGEGFGKNSDVRVIISGESFAKHGIFEDRTDNYEYLHTSFYPTISCHHSEHDGGIGERLLSLSFNQESPDITIEQLQNGKPSTVVLLA